MFVTLLKGKNMTTSKSTDTNAEIKEAQYRTSETLARFEKAMDHLADKVDHASGRIHHYRNILQTPKRNPSPFVVSALGCLAVFFIWKATQLKSIANQQYLGAINH